ncbi:hypothetical protein KHP62_19945 [Rhodobacteraceae bacterium NNCM2]|nr:hypothetical protein [Coraliihabitans acroporae]
MAIEYKAVGAPEKGRRKRGARSMSDRVAAAMEEILEREAVDGWEYLRTDLIPVEERSGWFGRAREVHRAVMIFRRGAPSGQVASPAPAVEAPGRAEQGVTPLRAVKHDEPSVTEPKVSAPKISTKSED